MEISYNSATAVVLVRLLPTVFTEPSIFTTENSTAITDSPTVVTGSRSRSPDIFSSRDEHSD